MKHSTFLMSLVAVLIANPLLHSQQTQVLPTEKYSVLPAPNVYLWPQGAPLATGNTDADKPHLTLYLPKLQRSKTGILLCPGGGYGGLSTTLEGTEIALWLNAMGIPAFVLQYRIRPYRHPVESLDAARAMRWVRAHADELHIAPDRIGIFGGSAGGHLASTISTHFDAGDPKAADPIDRVSDRPDFAILLYPVIDPIGPASQSTFNNLLGKSPDTELVEEYSNDKRVTSQTPPTFLALADDDTKVWPESSIRYYQALHAAGVSVEMHIYQRGGHGFGSAWEDPVPGQWRQSLITWLQFRGLLF
jgi:acetyl esterase/lipase